MIESNINIEEIEEANGVYKKAMVVFKDGGEIIIQGMSDGVFDKIWNDIFDSRWQHIVTSFKELQGIN